MSDDRTVLIVDDSATMRQLLKFAVKRASGGLRVLDANNGEEALKVLAAQAVDLMLTDVNMPLMDGITLIDRVRAIPKLAALPIVVITTEGEEAHRARALATGATDYVTKPIQSVAVVTVVRKILGIEAG